VPVLIRMFFAGRNDPHLNTMSPREGAHRPRGRSLSFPWAHTDAGSESAAAPERTTASSNPGSASSPHQAQARPAHSSEPILVPKLRISLADFPYLHYSIDQRLFTLETCCGYGYGSARKSYSRPRIFKGRHERSGHRKSRGALRWQHPYLQAN
jgi:hypothetical protein